MMVLSESQRITDWNINVFCKFQGNPSRSSRDIFLKITNVILTLTLEKKLKPKSLEIIICGP